MFFFIEIIFPIYNFTRPIISWSKRRSYDINKRAKLRCFWFIRSYNLEICHWSPKWRSIWCSNASKCLFNDGINTRYINWTTITIMCIIYFSLRFWLIIQFQSKKKYYILILRFDIYKPIKYWKKLVFR